MGLFRLGYSSKMRHLAEMLGLKYNQVASADLVCGYSCPMADRCKAFANRKTGKITDGKNCEYRCYGASLEAAFPTVRALHWNNFDLVKKQKTAGDIADILLEAIDNKLKVIRIHSFGDFFNKRYFQAWLNVAEKLPEITFFGYTKILSYLDIDRPDNFSMVYSFGGKLDADLKNEPASYVIKNIADAKKLGVEVSCQKHPADDYNYIRKQQSFALLLHGTQPKKTKLVRA